MEHEYIPRIAAVRCLVTFRWHPKRGWRAWASHHNREVLEPLMAYGGRIDKVRGKLMWNVWGTKVIYMGEEAKPYLTYSQRYVLGRESA